MFSWTSPRTKPLIIAHRGASRKAPENTLAAFSKAIDDGADGIELDVRLTADRRIVVIHDGRLRRTTDGKGVVESLTREELRSFSAGSWFHPIFSREKIPSLDEVFELVQRRAGVNIEIKSDWRKGASVAVVDEVLRVTRRHSAERIVLLSSFHHEFLRYAESVRPEIARGYLFHTATALARAPLRRTLRGSGAFLIVNGTSCTKRLVRRAHASGVLIGEYTVNTPRRLRRALRFGVDAIFTDDPSRILRELSTTK